MTRRSPTQGRTKAAKQEAKRALSKLSKPLPTSPPERRAVPRLSAFPLLSCATRYEIPPATPRRERAHLRHPLRALPSIDQSRTLVPPRSPQATPPSRTALLKKVAPTAAPWAHIAQANHDPCPRTYRGVRTGLPRTLSGRPALTAAAWSRWRPRSMRRGCCAVGAGATTQRICADVRGRSLKKREAPRV